MVRFFQSQFKTHHEFQPIPRAFPKRFYNDLGLLRGEPIRLEDVADFLRLGLGDGGNLALFAGLLMCIMFGIAPRSETVSVPRGVV